jgi:hypothetical protein
MPDPKIEGETLKTVPHAEKRRKRYAIGFDILNELRLIGNLGLIS